METIQVAPKFIDRTFYVHEQKKTADNRIVTVVYTYDKTNKVLSYGASIYRAERNKEYTPFLKREHRMTALGRLKKHPVIIPNIDDDSTLNEFHKRIRKFLYEKGCRNTNTEKID